MILLRLSLCFFAVFCLAKATEEETDSSERGPSRPACYVDYGCFYPRDGFWKKPESPAKIKTQFFLYTRENRNAPGQTITHENLGSFNPLKPIKFIIHGFTDTATNKWVTNLKEELLKSDDMNVIAVDWSGGNQLPFYDQAVANTPLVAAIIRQLLSAMVMKGARPQQVHLIGHSLGAQISGYVGQFFPNIDRISGLDPAGPDFYVSPVDRLDPTDASFVDVIHTDAARNVQDGFGHEEPLGHVDFYPNGGSIQPTCGDNTFGVLFNTAASLVGTLNIGNALDAFACNHMSAIFYFTDSINNNSTAIGYPCSNYQAFQSGQCTSCGINGRSCQRLGYHASPNGDLNNLYLRTLHGSKAPYFGRHLKVTVTSSPDNEQQTKGSISLRFSDESDVLLFNQDTEITRTFQQSKTILVSSSLLPLQDIRVSFQKGSNAFFGWGISDQWGFRSVDIFDLETMRSHRFCPTSAAKIKSGTHLRFSPCN